MDRRLKDKEQWLEKWSDGGLRPSSVFVDGHVLAGYKLTDVAALNGETLTAVTGEPEGEMMIFYALSGLKLIMHHDQDCCEDVSIKDIAGDLQTLIGKPLVMAEQISNQSDDERGDSETWTFYKFATEDGYVTVSWLGSSTGYYSEDVDMLLTVDDAPTP